MQFLQPQLNGTRSQCRSSACCLTSPRVWYVANSVCATSCGGPAADMPCQNKHQDRTSEIRPNTILPPVVVAAIAASQSKHTIARLNAKPNTTNDSEDHEPL